ncbi:hypothetical protein EDD16DRAFT_1661143 [Pisolithus croceorrhizus]|nr:hypothetical protein EDD16DRAFT_1661143 [Pisolithus croceorrhizus]KAI6135772.1 hypothetical protein EV401DRAFT_1881856 [Pisolithus croceorrhizus]
MSASTLSLGDAAHRGAPRGDSHYHADGSIFDQFMRSVHSPAGGNLSVLSYSPAHGIPGTRLRVTFTCKSGIGLDVRIRLVVGSLRVTTNIDESDPPGSGSWMLDASVPSFAKARWHSPTVPLTIEAVDKDNHVLDWVRFGAFTYEDAVLEESLARQEQSRLGYDLSSSSPPPPPPLRLVTGVDRPSKRKSPYGVPPTPVSDSDYAPSRSKPRPSQFVNQPPNLPGLRRARQGSEQNEQNSHNAFLNILTPLESLCYNWDESELQAGRRLVRFRRVQDLNNLLVSAEPISQAEYDPNDIVVSCIYREQTNTFCVTSVDIIHLLQRLVDAEFEVDEKNRIRRNLEGLRPTTVSKSRPGFEAFFQRIMDFPDPKPRKIEKDLKVFDWKLLPQALEKIISKYSMYTFPPSTSPGGGEDGSRHSASLRQNTTASSSKDERFEYFPSYDDGGSMTSATSTCHDAHLEMSQFAQLSPLAQLSPFPKEESNDCDPAQVRTSNLFPVQEGPLSLVYMDAVGLASNSDGGMAYDIHSSSDDICSDGASGESSLRIEPAHDWGIAPHQHSHDGDLMLGFSGPEPSVFRPETMHAQRHGHAYSNTQGHATPALVPADGHVNSYSCVESELLSLTRQYGYSSSQDSIDLYSPIRYSANVCDSFELQPREYSMDAHNGMSNRGISMSKVNAAALAGQVAF